MKKFLLGAAAFLALTSGALADTTPLLGIYNVDNVPFCAGQGTPNTQTFCNLTFKPEGLVYALPASIATATGTSAQTLVTFTLPANTLDVVGRRIKVHTVWHLATNGNTKTMTVNFGAGPETVSSGALTGSNVNVVLDMLIAKTGASTQTITGTGVQNTTSVTPYYATATETDTGALTITAIATDGTSSAADITLVEMTIEYAN